MHRTDTRPDDRALRAVWGLLGLLLVLRLLAMAGLPLMDTTEARYAEIARKMLAWQDWVTPWHAQGQPFWAKPPLSFWMTALSMRLFGVNEFAARLPHLLCGLAIAWMSARFALRQHTDAAQAPRLRAWVWALLGGSLLFVVSAGAVMTDAALVLCATGAMCAFWNAQQQGDRRAAWTFFVWLGLGLLAKGPLILVLVGLPLLGWCAWEGAWTRAWRALPWLRGVALALLVAAPWYGLAEQRTPGFLAYFIVGEHWHRFVTPGWAGDLYGKAHRAAPGTIWLFAFAAALPWSVLLPLAAWRRHRSAPGAGTAQASLRRYLWLWALTPLLFFSAARNIIWPYALPALPAAALLAAFWCLDRPAQSLRGLLAGLLASVAMMLGALGWAFSNGHAEAASARRQVLMYEREHRAGQPLIFLDKQPFSAEFYSRGQARSAATPEALRAQCGAAGCLAVLPEGMTGALLETGLRPVRVLGEGHADRLWELSASEAGPPPR
ncbi:glycosyltransferase family 39 protein [Pelomonas sp. CA6]|uniref:ArnT family glycosyltransferase n=1 Tax=Pelomonas sp. CA6 TaxID=2907999 RepID=UPI001F4C48A5|nr:glycosyltransferase family 39 protein [Pelomonas sp. CA6]MCH7345125.1 glycosyltransferase family 39 protein [Pelomonas sp. CA6]